MGADDALLADPAPVTEEGTPPTTNELLAQVRDEVNALPERLGAILRPKTPAADLPEVDGR